MIERVGRGALYVFDCLTHLADTWGPDQSISNFCALTGAVACFALLEDRHSSYAVEVVRATTQFMLDVFRLDDRLYIRPVKVQHRSREVINTIHVWQGAEFVPGERGAGANPLAHAVAAPAEQSPDRPLAALVQRSRACGAGLPGGPLRTPAVRGH